MRRAMPRQRRMVALPDRERQQRDDGVPPAGRGLRSGTDGRRGRADELLLLKDRPSSAAALRTELRADGEAGVRRTKRCRRRRAPWRRRTGRRRRRPADDRTRTLRRHREAVRAGPRLPRIDHLTPLYEEREELAALRTELRAIEPRGDAESSGASDRKSTRLNSSHRT